jgi:hypothetical protein
MGIINSFIKWGSKFTPPTPVVTFEGEELFDRYQIMRRDEWPDSWWDRHRDHFKVRPNKLPWWLPFNAFLHHWKVSNGIAESFHDHPRWSITICLKGKIIEMTPWGEKVLSPGSIILRSRKYIHAFKSIPGCDECWTLFIVGRRTHRQNTYQVTKR